MEIKTRITFEAGNEYGCITVKKQSYIENSGKEFPVSNADYRSFTPLQLNELKDYAPELYDICKAMWTPAVQKKYQDWLDSQPKLEA